MNLAIIFVSLLSIAALVLVGGAAFFEMRPVIASYRDERRRKRMLYADETMRVYTTVRFARARQGDHTGAIASLLFSLFLLMVGVWEWSRFDYGTEWQAVDGVITEARPEATAGAEAARNAVIEYRYTVGDQSFTGYWIDTPDALVELVGGGSFESRFQAGAPVTIWYHPLMPTFPSLSRVTLWYVVLALGSGGFLLVSSCLTLLFSRRPQRAFELG